MLQHQTNCSSTADNTSYFSQKNTKGERESQSVFRQQGHSALALWIDGQPPLIHLVEVVVWRASEALTIRVSIVVEFTSPIM